jgi:hypothetical protein
LGLGARRRRWAGEERYNQSTETTELEEPRGYVSGKKISARKRHLLVDTQGTLPRAYAQEADIYNRRSAEFILRGLQSRLTCQASLVS